MSRPGTLNWLQALRGISLLLVLLYHVGNIVDLHLGDPRIVRWFGFGHCGVDIFFVISGFIMFYLHGAEFGMPERAVAYLKKRWVRIYPIYWLLTTAVLVPALLIPGAVKAYKFAPVHLLECYLLFPLTYQGLPILPPAWSLFHEVKFYLFFALLILLRAPWHRLWLTGWALASLLFAAWIALTGAAFADTWDFFWLGPYNLEFLAGCLAGWILHHRRFPLRTGYLFLALGMGLLGFVAYQDVTTNTTLLARLAGYGSASVLLVLGGITLDVHEPSAPQAPRWMTLLGDASYSSYLVHYPLLFFMAKAVVAVLGRETATNLAVPLAGLLLVACLVGCLLVYRLVERPLLTQARRWAGLSPAPGKA